MLVMLVVLAMLAMLFPLLMLVMGLFLLLIRLIRLIRHGALPATHPPRQAPGSNARVDSINCTSMTYSASTSI